MASRRSRSPATGSSRAPHPGDGVQRCDGVEAAANDALHAAQHVPAQHRVGYVLGGHEDVARAEHEAGRAILIDIREPEEHATGVAAGARLLPMRQLNQRLAEIPVRADQPVLLICNTQNRSSATLRALRERGYGHVRYVSGGMSEWARRGWPLVRPAAAPGR